jgi:hypothetical protein
LVRIGRADHFHVRLCRAGARPNRAIDGRDVMEALLAWLSQTSRLRLVLGAGEPAPTDPLPNRPGWGSWVATVPDRQVIAITAGGQNVRLHDVLRCACEGKSTLAAEHEQAY